MSVRIINADVLAGLAELPDESVHCVVTSPPYFGLRCYGMDGQIGLEATPEAFVARMVEVFREVRRVLRTDGTCWLNLGDSYSGGKTGRADTGPADLARRAAAYGTGAGVAAGPREFAQRAVPDGLKPKDLIGIPWRVALALQADGWWLRSDVIWSKPNPMPESVTDRPTKSHEYLFLLTKAERYFFDAEAIKEPTLSLDPSHPSFRPNSAAIAANGRKEFANKHAMTARNYDPAGRNCRSVWTIATAPFAEAHFATFPPELPERCIKAGTSEKGCCAKCGAPWERAAVTTFNHAAAEKIAQRRRVSFDASRNDPAFHQLSGIEKARLRKVEDRGFSPSCACDAPAVPCTVLDPFGGAGTTGLVADRIQRNAVLIELNPEYAAMAEKRIANDAGGLFASVDVQKPAEVQMPLLEAAE
jgi:DNA modification methylase